jgi:acyl transferase domain-containing protein
VAQAFDLGGPAYSIDAACASGHVALSHAVSYLAQMDSSEGPAPVVLAGGVYLNLLPEVLVGFARTGALARRDCRPFDAEADGFVLGEGAGILVLKRLDHAERDGDRIYAVLRGVAVNSDGRNSNPLGPRLEGQIAVLRQGLAVSGVDAGQIGYVECHGTGTPAGDASELKALTAVLGDQPCRLGSVKANIGHALSACGIAGTLRAILALYHGVLPPQAGFESWHPSLNFRGVNFRIEQEALPWPGGIRTAMVNAFAFGGTNAIAILESAPVRTRPPETERPWLFCFSAPTAELLEEYRRAWLARAPEQSLASLAYTQTMTRLPHRFGCVVVARDFDQLAAPAPIFQLVAGPIHLPDLPPEDRAWLEQRGVELSQEGPVLESPSPLHALGWAWLSGQSVQLSDLFPERCLADLPAVPLVRQPYWIIQPEAAPRRLAAAGTPP